MSYTEHGVVKPQVIADTGVELLSEKTEVLNLFTKEVPDTFFGSHGDKVTVRVPGTLPVRTYGWRNDRSEPIKTDVYSETTVDITVNANDHYSAVKLTDEQKAFDFGGSFGRLTDAQTSTIAEKLNREALDVVNKLPFEYAQGVDIRADAIKEQAELGRDVFYNAFVDAGKALNKMRVPFSERVALVGANVAAEIHKSQKLVELVGNDKNATFNGATLGSYAGFTIVQDANVHEDEALVVSKSGIAYWNYAPAIPEGATKGAIASVRGISMRWIVDYDPAYQVDRSTWNTWNGFRHVEDLLVQINEDETQMVVGQEKFFTRGMKLIFQDGTGGYEPGDGGENVNNRKGADPESDLAKVWAGEPFSGRLPAGDDYPNVLATALERAGINEPQDLTEILDRLTALEDAGSEG